MSAGFDPSSYLDHVRGRILEHGWVVQAVFDPAGVEPAFSYTAGLSRYDGHPELVLYGLPPELAAGLLNDLGGRVRDGARLCPGQRLDDLIQRYDVVLVAVDSCDAGLTVAQRLYGGDAPVPALMVVWPDPEGYFPWDVEYSLHPDVRPRPPRSRS